MSRVEPINPDELCGMFYLDSFWSRNNISSPLPPLPVGSNNYLVHDTKAPPSDVAVSISSNAISRRFRQKPY
jgi:hypothetical protein